MMVGQGGESRIFKDPTAPDRWVLKIFRTPDAKRALKLEAMLKAKLALPQSAIVPLEAVRSLSGELVGYRMRRLINRYRKLGMIFGESFSKDHGFTTRVKVDLFSAMQKDLTLIHPSGIVVGDLNDGNEMVDEVDHGFVWIDMDSVQFGSFPCMAGTMIYLSPDLYGVDLTQRAMFKPEHDWFSFAVLLTRALTNGVHPFKSGLHAKYQSVTERARHKATVFDTDVSWPDIGLPPEVLGNELIGVLQKMLKRDVRTAFPLAALEQYKASLMQCSSCGIEYPAMRPKCPSCSKTTILDAQMAAAVAGFSVTTLLETKGRIRYWARAGSRIFAVTLEGRNHLLCSKDESSAQVMHPLPFNTPTSAWFGAFSDSFVVCPDPSLELSELHIVDLTPKGAQLRRSLTTTAFAGGRAVFATSDRFLYRIAGRSVLCCEKFGSNEVLERTVMQAHEGQTWFTAGRNLGPKLEVLAGFHREFSGLKWFVVRGDGRSFTRFDNLSVQPLEPGESMIDHEVYFSPDSVMVVRATRKRGVDRVRVDVVSVTDGTLLQSFLIEGLALGPWERIHGKAYANGLVMHPTDQGIVREKLADRSQNPLLFTQNHVKSLDDLDRLGGGIMVKKTDRVLVINP